MFEWVEEGAPGSSNINNISLAQFNVFSGLVVIPTPIDCIVHNSQAKKPLPMFPGDLRDKELWCAIPRTHIEVGATKEAYVRLWDIVCKSKTTESVSYSFKYLCPFFMRTFWHILESVLQVPLDPNLPHLFCLPCYFMARTFPAAKVHCWEASHRHDHPPHPHFHVFQWAQVFFLLSFSLHFISPPGLCHACHM